MTDPDPIECEEAVRRLARWLDGELRGRDAAELESHLETCRSCWSRAEFERRLREKIASLGPDGVRPAFERRIREMLDRFGRAS
ncbi:MAG: anti-sigma factor family protein [Gemmatimonadota bacterium]